MKKIILLLILIIIFNVGKSQSYYINKGDTLGVIITVQQAQQLDKDYDLLNLLKEYKIKHDSLDAAYLIVVDNFGKKVAELNLKVSKLEEINTNKDNMISNLKAQIEQYKKDVLLGDSQSAKKDTIISTYRAQNVKLKIQRTIAFAVGGGLTLLGIILLIL
jgi:hypothetical protein